jgi:hypothetical protein
MTTTTPEELQNKIVQIAARYLNRVAREVGELRVMIDKAGSSDMDVMRDIEALTHRMHGSGAMLHFDEISGHAGAMEKMAAGFLSAGHSDQSRMLELLQQLQVAIDKACAERDRQAAK